MLDNEHADSLLADETTTKVLATCRRLLKNDNFGLDDNFFDFGGHSLLAMVLALELESELGLPIETRQGLWPTDGQGPMRFA